MIDLTTLKVVLEKLSIDIKSELNVVSTATINAYLNTWKQELLAKHSNIDSIAWDIYNEPKYINYRIVAVLKGENKSEQINLTFNL